MQWFANLKTAYKLGLSFGMGIIITLIVGVIGLSRMVHIADSQSTTYKDEVTINKIGDLRADLLAYHRAEKNLIIETDDAEMDQYVANIDKFSKAFENDLADLKGMACTEKGRNTVATLEETWQALQPIRKQVAVLARSNKKGEAQRISKAQGRPLVDKSEQAIEGFAKFKTDSDAASNREATALAASSRLLIITLIIVGALFGLLNAGYITMLITVPLQKVMMAARGLAQGDTRQEITLVRKDEVGEIANAFRSLIAYQQEMAEVAEAMADGDLTHSLQPKSAQDTLGNAFASMITSLRELIREVTGSAEAVAGTSTQLSASAEQTGQASEEIAHSMQDVAQAADQSAKTSTEMAQGSEQQARSATEATAQMQQLTAAVRQVQESGQHQVLAAQQANQGMQEASKAVEEVARSSQQMAHAARQANTVAQTGGKAVEQTVASMRRIKEQVATSAARITELGELSKAIGAIVETIDQIAEQTNLLALNAAIEAARAGEHGKGFAVVADEVRKLAERATGATTEVSTLIGKVKQGVEEAVRAMQASNQEVTEGASRSQEAGEALTQILQAAQSVAAEVENVSAIAEQMAASVQEVTATVETVRRSAEENSRTVQEMASGADRVSMAISSVASISEETAAGAEEMSASAEEVSASAQTVTAALEEQSASIEEVNASASELSSMAAHLQELISRFRLEADAQEDKPRQRYLAKAMRKAA